MKINRKSWHYRLLKWSWPEEYLVGFYAPNGERYETKEDFKAVMGRNPSQWNRPPEIGTDLPKMSLCEYCYKLFAFMFLGLPVMGFGIVFLSPFIGIVYICCRIEEAWQARKTRLKDQPSGPRTLLGKWLKAKKDKVCPILEWE